MARLGASKKKKSPHTADPRQIKKELKRVTEQLESRDRELEQRNAELREGAGASDGNRRGARHHQPLADGRAAGPRRHRRERRPGLWNRCLVLRLREGNAMVPRAHFWSAPITSPEISVDELHTFAGCASVARSTFLTLAPRMISGDRFRRRLSHLSGRSSSSAGGTHWGTGRTSRRGTPLHPGADQAS